MARAGNVRPRRAADVGAPPRKVAAVWGAAPSARPAAAVRCRLADALLRRRRPRCEHPDAAAEPPCRSPRWPSCSSLANASFLSRSLAYVTHDDGETDDDRHALRRVRRDGRRARRTSRRCGPPTAPSPGPGASTPTASAPPPPGLHGLGVRRGDTVALWLSNRPEFHVADTAAMQLGAAPFSIYSTFTVEQAEHVVGDAGSRVLVTEPAYLERALAVRERGRTALELIVLVDGAHTQRAELGRAARRRAGRLRRRRGRGGGVPGRPRDADLHVGHDRRAEGRRAHAPQRRGAVRRARRGARARAAAARDLVAADGAHRRAAVHPLHPDAPRVDGDVPRRPARDRRRCCPRCGRSSSSRRRGCGRSCAPRRSPSSAIARRRDRARGAGARRGPRRDHRRGAVPGRGDRVLARARPAAVRGLRHVRDDRRGDGQRARTPCGSAPSAARCRASRSRCRTPARC